MNSNQSRTTSSGSNTRTGNTSSSGANRVTANANRNPTPSNPSTNPQDRARGGDQRSIKKIYKIKYLTFRTSWRKIH